MTMFLDHIGSTTVPDVANVLPGGLSYDHDLGDGDYLRLGGYVKGDTILGPFAHHETGRLVVEFHQHYRTKEAEKLPCGEYRLLVPIAYSGRVAMVPADAFPPGPFAPPPLPWQSSVAGIQMFVSQEEEPVGVDESTFHNLSYGDWAYDEDFLDEFVLEATFHHDGGHQVEVELKTRFSNQATGLGSVIELSGLDGDDLYSVKTGPVAIES
jgi:hypothetical protein